MNVLLVSENCSRRMGGEAILSYHYFRLLESRGCNVHLLVHERNKQELEELFPQCANRFHYINDTKFQKLFWRMGSRLPRRIAEVTLFLLVFVSSSIRMKRAARSLVRAYQIDIVHQIVPVSPRAPSFIYDVGAPVIIGPMNGAMEYPAAFRKRIGPGEKIAYSLGKSMGRIVNLLVPGKRKASLLLAANSRTEACISKTIGKGPRVNLLVENGVDLDLWKMAEDGDAGSQIPVFLFVGRLIELKGVDYLLRAFKSLLAKMPAELIVIGDGPEGDPLKALACEIGIAPSVKFLGFMPQDALPSMLRKSRALVLPSLCECGGSVVLEAMAAQRAVIATDWGGPADYLDASCGFLVKTDSEDGFIGGLSSAMESLARDPALAERMGKCGRMKIESQFDWRKKIDTVMELYQQNTKSR
jgi:glycosyltransferase involved in cell wall biosynthesis